MRIGQAVMRPIFEIDEIRMPYQAFVDDVTDADLKRAGDWLFPYFIDPATNECRLSQHAWLIEIHGKRILVDPCVGAQRHRPALSFYHMIDSPLLRNLRAAGVEPETIDYVFCTHLHLDHVGWNTRLENGRYVPTFPNARYLFSAVEEAYWRQDLSGGLPPEEAFNQGVFAECILPVQQAGLAQLVTPGDQVAGCLSFIDASGHTPGHLAGVLESGREGAVLAGDAIHHPLQAVFHTHLCNGFDPPRAVASRMMLLELCAKRDYWLAPAHFKAPHLCKVARTGKEYRLIWDTPSERRGVSVASAPA